MISQVTWNPLDRVPNGNGNLIAADQDMLNECKLVNGVNFLPSFPDFFKFQGLEKINAFLVGARENESTMRRALLIKMEDKRPGKKNAPRAWKMSLRGRDEVSVGQNVPTGFLHSLTHDPSV